MSQESVEQLLGRLMTDDRFRERAKTALAQSSVSAGYVLSNAECGYLSKLDFDLLNSVAVSLDDAIRRN